MIGFSREWVAQKYVRRGGPDVPRAPQERTQRRTAVLETDAPQRAVLSALHIPAYAGAYVYGHRKHTMDLDGHHRIRTKAQVNWTVLIAVHHPGNLTWAQFEHNQQALAADAADAG